MAVALDPSRRWLFSARTDLLAFSGSVALAALVALASPSLGLGGDTPPWAWLLFVVGFDVSHVWATLYRVYLDPAEVRRRPLLYGFTPVVAWALGVAAHAVSSAFFWRVLAYAAAWHFVRQQVGWMVLYGRRARLPEWEVWVDRATLYAVTLGPLVWWHARLPLPFWWFKENDFLAGLPAWLGDGALGVQFAALAGWLGVHLWRARTVGLHWGRLLLLASSWVAWFGGIVLAPNDFAFTTLNVVMHGVPYLTLLYVYARGRAAEGGFGPALKFVKLGVPAFLGLLFALAFGEEWLWDRLAWHEHPQFFGAGGLDLSDAMLTLVVPLLAMPQVAHYILDAYVWRTRDDAALAGRLGWGSSPAPGATATL